MRQRADDGSTRQAHLEAAAASGSVTARAALEGPEFPDALAYLWDAFMSLDAMRTAGFNGWERLSPSHIRDGLALFGWEFAPHEIEALVVLDAVLMSEQRSKEEKSAAPRSRIKSGGSAAWPKRKR